MCLSDELMDGLPPPEKLEMLADWLDIKTPEQGNEVQVDLRKWASNIRKVAGK